MMSTTTKAYIIMTDNGGMVPAGKRGRHSASSATGGVTRPARPSCCTAEGLCACNVPGAPSLPAVSCARGAPPNGKLANCCRSVPGCLHNESAVSVLFPGLHVAEVQSLGCHAETLSRGMLLK